ncbi:MAG: outer membrane protein assembly factor BamA [Myxococcales bacterium]
MRRLFLDHMPFCRTLLAGLALAWPALAMSTPLAGALLRPPWVAAEASPDELAGRAQLPWGKTIVLVDVAGTHRVEKDAVRAVLKQKTGYTLTRAGVADDIRAVFKLDYFADVAARVAADGPNGVDLTYAVVEKPAVHAVTYTGNEELSADDLKELIDIKPYSILSIAAVLRNEHKIHDKYIEKGYYLAEIDHKLVPRPNNEVDIVYQIHEHAKVSVRRITFIGNHSLPASDLRSAMQTQEGGWFSFITSSGTFREDALEQDVAGIQGVYYDRGFINVRVAKPTVELSADKRYIYVSIRIDEGEQYRLGTLDFSGDLVDTKPAMLRKLSMKSGELFSRTKLLKDRSAIDSLYQDQGYAYANITPRTAVHQETRLVDLAFDVQKGEKVYVEKIEISGNTKTRDKVIRRELRVYEGELFSGTGIRVSKQRVQALGFFETVEVTTRKGSAPNLTIVSVQVKERPTGTFQVGAGFSSLESFILTAQVSQNNLLGWGQTASLTAQLSAIRQFLQLQYVDPYFLDTKWTLAADAFRTEIGYFNFLRQATGGDLTFGYEIPFPKSWGPLFEDFRIFATYMLQDVATTPFYQGTQQVELANEFQTGILSSLRASVTWDKRNDRMYPSKGFMFSQSAEIAPSWLGSQFTFTRYSGFFRFYVPLPFGAVFKTNWTYGLIDGIQGGQAPVSERYFVGGINSLRGYYIFTVSPTRPVGNRTPDSTTQDFEIGGNKELVFNNEIEFPILEKIGIRGVVFYDLGDCYSEDENFFQDKAYPNLPLGMLHAVGFGVRWFSPIGPLRFEWGFPLTPRPQDQVVDFEFTIGNFF